MNAAAQTQPAAHANLITFALATLRKHFTVLAYRVVGCGTHSIGAPVVWAIVPGTTGKGRLVFWDGGTFGDSDDIEDIEILTKRERPLDSLFSKGIAKGAVMIQDWTR